MADAVVIGGGPGAVHAAAALRQAGRQVVLLQEGAFPGQVSQPDVPVGRGIGEAPSHSILGGVTPVSGLGRAVVAHDHILPLPLAPNHVFRLMPPSVHPAAAQALARARGRLVMAELIGGGRELRTYRDWVVQHFGEPIFNQLFAPYCRKRFGDPAEVTANAARLAHLPRDVQEVALADGPAAAQRHMLDGVEVHLHQTIVGLAAGRVDTAAGSFEGDVFVDVAPKRVVAWLGGATHVQHEVSRLRHRHAIEVMVDGGAELPYETHVVDERAGFYRLVRPGRLPGCGGLGSMLVAHYSIEADDTRWRLPDDQLVSATVTALKSIGVADAAPGRAQVRRIADHHPVWVSTHASRMRTYVLAMEKLNITPVGRAGLFAPLHWGGELGWLAAIGSDTSVRDRMRAHVEPSVDDTKVHASLTALIVR